MPNRPVVMGLETEFGISVQDGEVCMPDYTNYTAFELVSAIKELALFVDRGLEQIENVDEHERAEQEAAQQNITNWEEEWDYIRPKEKTPSPLRQRLGYSGFILETGARWYVDMGHPEYSTPETTDPYTLVLAQKAGDIIADQCRILAETDLRQRWGKPNLTIHLHRDNSDGQGHSYAGHENYSLSPWLFDQIIYRTEQREQARERNLLGQRRLRLDDLFVYESTNLTNMVLKFLATRSIIIGSGKVGSEEFWGPVDYQISQRADFMMMPVGISTVYNRGIINTRNQPLAAYDNNRRFHTICGDSNMSELSIYLKCGITALFFKMLEDGIIQNASGDLTTPLCDPVAAFREISRDLTLRKPVTLNDYTSTTALETQMRYCDLAKSYVIEHSMPPVWHDVVTKWEAVLNGLNTNRFKNQWSNSLDWVVKERLLKSLQKQRNVDPTNIACRSLALAYHDNNPEASIYDRLLKNGKITRIVQPEEIMFMTRQAPSDTRAWFRGEMIARYPTHILDIGWYYIIFEGGILLEMDQPLQYNQERMKPILADNPEFPVFLQRLSKHFPARDLFAESRTSSRSLRALW